MQTDSSPEGRSSLQKVILLATVVSGFVAAYVSSRRIFRVLQNGRLLIQLDLWFRK